MLPVAPDRAYVAGLARTFPVTAEQLAVLDASGVSTHQDLLSLFWNFPSLSTRFGFDVPSLSNYAAQQSVGFLGAVRAAEIAPGEPREFPLGAGAPAETPFRVGYEVPLSVKATSAENQAGRDPVPLMSSETLWPVRNQGQRGTCVAFALSAMLEAAGSAASRSTQLSPQLLFWATKHHGGDPSPNTDGTFLSYGVEALAKVGICKEDVWAYDGQVIPGNVSHCGLDSCCKTDALPTECLGRPTPEMLALAGLSRIGLRNAPTRFEGGNASRVRQLLSDSGQPVAVSLPVFADPVRPRGHNWNSPVGDLFGKVLDPPIGSIAIAGHAVAIVGFSPDKDEPMGGHFIFRNSWGALWGSALPSEGYAATQPGYGQLSATYMDRYIWEIASF